MRNFVEFGFLDGKFLNLFNWNILGVKCIESVLVFLFKIVRSEDNEPRVNGIGSGRDGTEKFGLEADVDLG